MTSRRKDISGFDVIWAVDWVGSGRVGSRVKNPDPVPSLAYSRCASLSASSAFCSSTWRRSRTGAGSRPFTSRLVQRRSRGSSCLSHSGRPTSAVLHAAAGLYVLNVKQCDRMTPVLRELHWLPVAERRLTTNCLLVHSVFTRSHSSVSQIYLCPLSTFHHDPH